MEHNLFKPSGFEEGKHSVVGDCNGFTMQQRWDAETPVFADAILSQLKDGIHILDYGCGVGRLAKAVIDKNQSVTLVGLDASAAMMKQATEYVNNSRFFTASAEKLLSYGKFDLVYCVYVLQHCPSIELREVLWRIYSNLKDDGVFVYCSSDYRMAIRYDNGGFFDDRFLGVNLQEEISRFFIYEKDLFTDEILEKSPIVKTMIHGSLPHPAKVYRKKPNINFLNLSIDKEETVSTSISVETNSKPITEADKLLFVNRLAPGDILVMTNAIRDLHKAYPNKFKTDVRTPCPEIFENSPYITHLNISEDKYNKAHNEMQKKSGYYEWIDDVVAIDMQYPLIHRSGDVGAHFSEGHRSFLEEVLQIKIPQTSLKPELYLNQTERDWLSPVVVQKGIKNKYWVINAGVKGDYTLKQYPYYQEVVNLLKDKVTFVQIGEKSHFHKSLDNVIDMVGKTNMRELFRLIYKAEGVLTCVSFPMHIAAAFMKPCVVVAGAREGTRWELYPNHQFIYVNGCLPCATYDGCWKSKPDECKNKENDIPRCMLLIKPERVAESVNMFYEGRMLTY